MSHRSVSCGGASALLSGPGAPVRLLTSTLLFGALLPSLPTATQAKPPEPVPSCGQRGRVTFDKDTTLADASGRRLARFSGGESAVTLLAPPAGGSGLARIENSTRRR